MMQIFEIQEPRTNNPSNTPSISTNDIAIGIDFGTTNSLVAFSQDRKAYIIDDALIPSIIGDDLSIGKEGIKSIKRLIGKPLSEIATMEDIVAIESDGVIKVQIGNSFFSIAETISLILSLLKSNAELHLKQKVTKAVITVPARFDDVMRNIVKHAANLAGLEVLRLISEPTAAAYAYGLENGSEGLYLVYDFGGGTFDVSLLNMRMGVFQVIATDGEIELGGDDIDYLLASYLGCTDLEAKRIKEDIASGKKSAITEETFETLIDPIISRTIEITKSLAQNHLSKIKGIILVGGSSRIPLVRKKLTDLNVPILSNIDPDKAVALGAALQAENLTRKSKDLIIDIVPLSLGMELMGGVVEKIILRNTPLPVSVTKEFTTYADNQTGMKFNIVQGEREMVHSCRSLASFELVNIPPMKAGAARVEVTFSLDVDAILSISAIEKTTGAKQIIEVNPVYGIGNNEISSMLEDAYKNVANDHHARLLAETQLEAKQEIQNLEAAISETPELLSRDEIKDINSLIKSLKEYIGGNDREKIAEILQKLQEQTREFAEKRMDFAVRQILKGKMIE